MKVFTTFLELVGLGLVVAGLAMVSVPVGVMGAGVAMILVSILVTR